MEGTASKMMESFEFFICCLDSVQYFAYAKEGEAAHQVNFKFSLNVNKVQWNEDEYASHLRRNREQNC